MQRRCRCRGRADAEVQMQTRCRCRGAEVLSICRGSVEVNCAGDCAGTEVQRWCRGGGAEEVVQRWCAEVVKMQLQRRCADELQRCR
jgi:hypothetical protein